MLKGTVRFRLISADVSGFLTDAAAQGIVVQDVQITDALTITATVERKSLGDCRKLAERRSESFSLLGRLGTYWHVKRLIFRPAILVFVGILLLATITIPRHIFFVRVAGNSTVSEKYILEQAELCGIAFGAGRSQVRSEKIKNALLQKIPQLQWVGITTKGCVATITVREKTVSSAAENAASGVYSVVASQSGIITGITTERGNLACRVGQAVKEGQVLISGYTDCGLSIRATQAEGEVYAQTLRTVSVITPSEAEVRSEATERKTRYYLKIGKKLIKLCKDSGISTAGCVKMYSQKNLTLPGGFALPISLITEELIYYSSETLTLPETDMSWLESAVDAYLVSQMVAGRILSKNTELSNESGLFILEGQYTCNEMIGRLKNEEIILPNGENG